jgi:hypothetical protein
MSGTPDLGKMTTAPFAVFSILVLVDYGSFSSAPLFMVFIFPTQGSKQSGTPVKVHPMVITMGIRLSRTNI